MKRELKKILKPLFCRARGGEFITPLLEKAIKDIERLHKKEAIKLIDQEIKNVRPIIDANMLYCIKFTNAVDRLKEVIRDLEKQ